MKIDYVDKCKRFTLNILNIFAISLYVIKHTKNYDDNYISTVKGLKGKKKPLYRQIFRNTSSFFREQ